MEGSRTEPSQVGCEIYSTLNQLTPCTQGNLTFFTVWFNGFGSGSGPEFEPFKHNWAFEHIGSVPDPWHFGMDPNADADPRNLSYDQRIRLRLRIRFRMQIQLQILLFSSVTFKIPTKNNFFSPRFYAYSFLKLHLHHYSKMKSHKEVTEQWKSQFFFSSFFCLLMAGSGSVTGAGSTLHPPELRCTLLSWVSPF